MTAPIIKVVMTGPTGTGKTSLLAAMYPHLETQFPGGDYELLPDENTRTTLDKLRDKLSQLGEGGIVVKDKRITGNAQSDEFNFALQYEEDNGTKSTELSLQVFDIPGAYCTENNGEEAKKFLFNSDVSFWCIDSVALMKGKDEAINAPKIMAETIRKSKLNPYHSVCLVLMRSETWEHNNEYQQLIDKFRTEFGSAVADLRSNDRIKTVYYCSVQTTGNLHFSYYEGEEPKFVRSKDIDGYNPKHCELPVLCAVRSALKSEIERQKAVIDDIINNEFPFSRYLPFLPGYWKYHHALPKAERLRTRLSGVSKEIKEKLESEAKNKRLFTWGE
jgi:hypothetical protein